MTITPGQSLTPEQVRNLPDGAVVRMHKSDRPYLELTVKNGELDIPNCSYNDTQPKGWFALPLATYRWESCLLVSLPPAPSEPGSRIEPQAEPANPELPVWVITCDRCGTTYKNNERHACAPKKYTQSDLLRGVTMEKHGAEIEQMPDYTPPQPELDSDYRWVNIGERIIGTDEYLTGYGEWMQTGGLEFKCTVAKKYRRRIEPQAEPAKPERQASEIEKRAAVALLENCKSSIVERVDSGFNASLRISCEWYIEAYDYAKSIGAIE